MASPRASRAAVDDGPVTRRCRDRAKHQKGRKLPWGSSWQRLAKPHHPPPLPSTSYHCGFANIKLPANKRAHMRH